LNSPQATGLIGGGTWLNASVTHDVLKLESGTLKAGTKSIADGDGTQV
jgi:hypothetical protein